MGVSKMVPDLGESNLKVLKELTPKLPPIGERIFSGRVIPSNAFEGTTNFGIFKNGDASLSLLFGARGDSIPPHSSLREEMIGLISGAMTVRLKNGSIHEIEMLSSGPKARHILTVKPCCIHDIEFIEDTWLWIVSTSSLSAPE